MRVQQHNPLYQRGAMLAVDGTTVALAETVGAPIATISDSLATGLHIASGSRNVIRAIDANVYGDNGLAARRALGALGDMTAATGFLANAVFGSPTGLVVALIGTGLSTVGSV